MKDNDKFLDNYLLEYMSHISKLVRDIASLGDGVKKKLFYYVVTNRGGKVFQCHTTLPNRLEMHSRDKIRWIHAAVAGQTRSRR